MISHDDLGLVPWKSTRHSMEFPVLYSDQPFLQESTGMGLVKSGIPAIVLVEYGRTLESSRNTAFQLYLDVI